MLSEEERKKRISERVKLWRLNNLEECRRKDREKYKKNKVDKKRTSLDYYYEHKKEVLNYQIKRWSKKYAGDSAFQEKRRLRDKSRMDVKGKMLNLQGCVCSMCGSGEDLQRHHPSYSSTDFIVLCRGCHNKVHEEIKGVKV
jgi:hypothetical protein